MKQMLQEVARTIVYSLFVLVVAWVFFQWGIQRGIALAKPLRMPTVLEIQNILKAMDEPRYDPGKVDDDPGSTFRTAYNAYRFDLYAQVYFPEEEDE